MNGNTDESWPGGLIHPAHLTDILFDGLASTPGRFASGGIIRPSGSARDDRVVIGFDVGLADTGVVFVRPIEGGNWGVLGTMLEGLHAEPPAPPAAGEVMEIISDFMARYGSAPEADADEAEPVAERPAVPIEEQIDRAIAGLCLCGAPRREPSEELPDGSPYCSYDCEPNHVVVHTDPRETGFLATPSRWRPDLVTAVDDTGLVSVQPRRRRGRFWAEVFERAGTDQLHLRLDDDIRFVGADVPRGEGDEHDERCARKWAALARELADGNRTAAEERDEEIRYLFAIARMQQLLRARERIHQAQMELQRSYSAPEHVHWAFDAGAVRRMMSGVAAAAEPLRRMFDNFSFAGRGMARVAEAGAEPPEDQRERALRMRRERNTGPQAQPRAPRRIDARGLR